MDSGCHDSAWNSSTTVLVKETAKGSCAIFVDDVVRQDTVAKALKCNPIADEKFHARSLSVLFAAAIWRKALNQRSFIRVDSQVCSH